MKFLIALLSLFFLFFLLVPIEHAAKSPIPEPDMGENFERSCTNNVCSMRVYAYQKYYQDESGWQFLNTSFDSVNCLPGFPSCVDQNEYQVSAKNTYSSSELIAVSINATTLRFSPLTLLYRNEWGEMEKIADALPVSAEINQNRISYPGIFGPGTTLQYTYEATTLKEELIVENPLPVPTLTGSVTLDVDFLFTTNDTTETTIENTPFTTKRSGKWANIKKQNSILFSFPPPIVLDARGHQTPLEYGFQSQGTATLITVKTPYDIVNASTYPLIIDPTLVVGSADIAFDGTVQNLTAGIGTYTRLDADGLFIGRNVSAGLEHTLRSVLLFNLQFLPQNSVVKNVNLTVFVNRTETFNDRIAIAHMENNSTYYSDTDAGNKEFFIDMENGTMYNTANITGISTDFFTFNLDSSTPDISAVRASTQVWFGLGLSAPVAESRNFIPDDIAATRLSSNEDANTTQRPFLTITYTLPQPQLLPISPPNMSEIGGVDIPTLTFRVTDNEANLASVEVYGSNGTGISVNDLLYQNTSVLNNSLLTFNWGSPLAVWNKNTILLVHFDSRSVFGENITTVVDRSLVHYNGTANNAIPNLTAGKFAGSYSFNGNGNVTFGNIPVIGSNFTYAVWVQSFATTGNHTIISKMNDTDSGLWVVQRETNLTIYANESSPAVDIHGVFARSDYTHITIVVSESNVSVFVNGILNASGNISGVSANTESFTVGSRRNRSFFIGNIDELQVFNRTLLAHEVRNLVYLQNRTYFWKVAATDATPDTNVSGTFQFDYDIPPIITLLSPTTGRIFTGVGNIELNASAQDISSPLKISFFGSSGQPTTAELLYQSISSSVLFASYNWTAPVQTRDPNTVLLLHFDNRSIFAENDTVVRDFSALENTASCVNCPTTNISFGKFGGTFDFNGNQVFNITNPNRLDLNTTFTVEAWINPSISSTNLLTSDTIISKGSAYRFFHDNVSRTVNFFLAGITCNATSQLNAHTWYHVATAFNGSALFVYVNGILEQTCLASSPANNANGVTIGSGVAGDFFHGKIDELVIRNVSLSTTQIRDHVRLAEGQYYWTVNATDAAGSNGVSSIRTFNVTRYLDVLFISPANNTNLPVGSTFLVNVSIICRAESCGGVSGTLLYNASDTYPDTPITSGPFTLVLGETNPKGCNDSELVNNDYCNLTWQVNVTGSAGERYTLGSNITSNMTGIRTNRTVDNNTVSFISCLIDLFPQFSAVTFFTGVPGSILNGSGNLVQEYNITTGSTNTCNVDVYLKSTNLNFSTDPSRNIGVGNMSFGNTSNLYINAWSLSNSYQMLRSNIPIVTNITSYYWLRVPPAFAGDYSGIITYIGVKSGEIPS